MTAGSFETVPNIPTGTVCTVTEPTLPDANSTPPAPVGYSFGTPTFTDSSGTANDGIVTITPKDAVVEVRTNNTLTRDLGTLKLSKALTGGPAGYTGPFTIAYDCGTGFTGTKSVTAGSFETVPNIPTGTVCTVTEPTLPDANSTPPAPVGYSFGTPTFTDSSGTANDGIVTITPKDAVVEVRTNNTLTRDLGTLKLSKALTGGPAGYTGPFTIAYDCGIGFTGTKSVTAGSFETVPNIPTGTVCTVTEPTLPDANSTPPAPVGYSFGTPTFTDSSGTANDGIVTITPKDAVVEVRTNNTLTRDLGTLKLSKALTGGPAGYTGPFTIAYDCGIGFTGTKSVTAGSFETVPNIPTGTVCTVTEPTLPDANSTPPAPVGYSFGTPTFTDSSGTANDGIVTITPKDAVVEVRTNNTLTRDRGSFTIAKSLTNDDGAQTPTLFVVNYDCGVDANGAALTGSRNVPANGSASVSGIPTGNTCSVTEVAPDAIPGYTWQQPITYSPASIEIEDETGEFLITVGNTITKDRGTFTIAKSLTNDDDAPRAG